MAGGLLGGRGGRRRGKRKTSHLLCRDLPNHIVCRILHFLRRCCRLSSQSLRPAVERPAEKMGRKRKKERRIGCLGGLHRAVLLTRLAFFLRILQKIRQVDPGFPGEKKEGGNVFCPATLPRGYLDIVYKSCSDRLRHQQRGRLIRCSPRRRERGGEKPVYGDLLLRRYCHSSSLICLTFTMHERFQRRQRGGGGKRKNDLQSYSVFNPLK